MALPVLMTIRANSGSGKATVGAMIASVSGLSDDVRKAVAALPAGYLELLGRVSTVLQDDRRVAALWLSGSVARGVADAGSDLDLIVTVADAHFDDWVATLRGLLERQVEPVIVVAIPGMRGSYACTTSECLRLDVVSEMVTELTDTPFRRRLVVFDEGTLVDRIPAPGNEPGPDPDRLLSMVREFFRLMAIFPAAVVAREDWLLGQEGAHALRGLLYQLFVELNQPLPAMGIKRWSAKLTEDQRSVLAALPLPTPDRESVVTATHLLGQAFTSHARQAQLSVGSEWPDQAEAAVAAYWIASGLTPETRWHQAREAASSPPNITDQNGTE